MPELKPSRMLMLLLYENAIYFLLDVWVKDHTDYEEEKIRKARRVLQDKCSYNERVMDSLYAKGLN